MDVVPCTCTYECEFIQLPDVQTLSDFVFDPTDYDDWYIVSDEDFTKKYTKIQEVNV